MFMLEVARLNQMIFGHLGADCAGIGIICPVFSSCNFRLKMKKGTGCQFTGISGKIFLYLNSDLVIALHVQLGQIGGISPHPFSLNHARLPCWLGALCKLRVLLTRYPRSNSITEKSFWAKVDRCSGRTPK